MKNYSLNHLKIPAGFLLYIFFSFFSIFAKKEITDSVLYYCANFKKKKLCLYTYNKAFSKVLLFVFVANNLKNKAVGNILMYLSSI